MTILDLFRSADRVNREAAAIHRAVEAERKLTTATVLLDNLVRAEGMAPHVLVITKGMYRRGSNPETGELLVDVPRPAALEEARRQALAYLGRSI